MQSMKFSPSHYERLLGQTKGYCKCCGEEKTLMIIQSKIPPLLPMFFPRFPLNSIYLGCECCGAVKPLLGMHVI